MLARLTCLASPSRVVLAVVATLTLTAGCGGSSGDDTDATPPIDAPVAGPVTITVTGANGPVAGIDVVWTDPEGAIVAHEATNSAGQATEDLFAGSAVTLASSGPSTRVTATWLDLEPGDELTWSFGRPAGTQVSTLSLTLPGPRAGATSYRVTIGCAEFETTTPGAPVTGPIDDDCLGSDQTIDAVALALDATGQPVAYDHATSVAVNSGGTTVVNLDAWQTSYDVVTLDLTSAPTDVTASGMDTHLRIDGLDFGGPSVGGTTSGGTIQFLTGYWQGGIVDQLEYLVYLARGTQSAPAGMSILMDGRSDAPTTVSLDGSQLLPTLTETSADDNAGQPRISWTATGSFAGADAALVIASWRDAGITHQAFVMAPPDVAPPITLPALPEALADYRSTVDAVFLDPTVIFADADFVADYRGFRPAGWGAVDSNATDYLPAAGGRVRYALGGTLPGQNVARRRGLVQLPAEPAVR